VLAKKTGLTVRALRHYESLNLPKAEIKASLTAERASIEVRVDRQMINPAPRS
jgi:hypothetical protein